jgi:glucan phosphoethanolaminetransferase (alkaline phosphatase superfamily)
MIQRIQTVFLAVVALCMTGVLFTPIWSKVEASSSQSIELDALNLVYRKGELTQQTPVFYLAVMAIFAIIIAVFAIFQYKSRMKQVLFVALNSLLIGILLGIAVYMVYSKGSPAFAPETRGEFGIGFYLIFGALVSNWLANTFIRRDERMVREADRMR